jgi:putative (di)nucleoside polyphosphate hydrolase
MGEGSSEKTEARLQDLLGDPIVHLVMQSDNVDERKLRALLERLAASMGEWRDVPRPAANAERGKSMTSNDGYRRGVGIVLLNHQGEVFVGQRNDVSEEAWQMPQGGIDEGESPRDAAIRELQEELGTSKVEVVAETNAWFRYDLPAGLLGGQRHSRWRGQQQKWFLMRFVGQDSDINTATEHREFSDWQWVTTDRAVELIVPFKRELYLHVFQEFADLPKRAGLTKT